MCFDIGDIMCMYVVHPWYCKVQIYIFLSDTLEQDLVFQIITLLMWSQMLSSQRFPKLACVLSCYVFWMHWHINLLSFFHLAETASSSYRKPVISDFASSDRDSWGSYDAATASTREGSLAKRWLVSKFFCGHVTKLLGTFLGRSGVGQIHKVCIMQTCRGVFC